MAQIISNEIPSGVIDGANLIYTTAFPIQQVLSLSVDWAEYYWFSFNDTTLTLQDAPTLSIHIDYLGSGFVSNPVLTVTTLQDLRLLTRSTYLKIDPNAKVWSDDTLDVFINQAYHKVQSDMSFEWPEYETSVEITTVAWTETYTKPSDFVRLIWLYDDTYNLTKTSKQQTMIVRATESKPSSYYLYGSSIGFYPVPDNAYTIDLLYYRQLPFLTSSQGSGLPYEYNQVIALYATYLMLISVEKQPKAIACLAEYTNIMNWLFAKDMYDDDNIRFWQERNTERVRDDAL